MSGSGDAIEPFSPLRPPGNARERGPGHPLEAYSSFYSATGIAATQPADGIEGRLGLWRNGMAARKCAARTRDAKAVVGGAERDRTADLLIAKWDAINVARRQ